MENMLGQVRYFWVKKGDRIITAFSKVAGVAIDSTNELEIYLKMLDGTEINAKHTSDSIIGLKDIRLQGDTGVKKGDPTKKKEDDDF